MKKILFNDFYDLTQAVLDGRKTQTRRIVPRSFFTCTHDILDNNTLVCEDEYGDWHDIRETRYALQVGEVVAVAQNYKDAGVEFVPIKQSVLAGKKSGLRQYGWTKHMAGYNNKMFTAADVLPHRIRITDVRVERLQDISESDCIKELGLDYVARDMGYGKCQTEWVYQFLWEDKLGRTREYNNKSPKRVFEVMIDLICGKGTWDSNPYVFAYTFELVK